MGYLLSLSRTLIRNISRGNYVQTVNCSGATATVALGPGKTLSWIVCVFPAGTNISVGTTPGGTELVDNEPVAANTPFPIQIGYTAGGVTETIYFTGTVAAGYIDVYNF